MAKIGDTVFTGRVEKKLTAKGLQLTGYQLLVYQVVFDDEYGRRCIQKHGLVNFIHFGS
jgi:hypothetical protein